MIRYEFELPWPPSANRYWRLTPAGVKVSREGREYRIRVRSLITLACLPPLPGTSELRIEIRAWVPDRRRRDLDNILKVTLDSLQFSALVPDDHQVGEIMVVRRGVEKGGKLLVSISEVETPSEYWGSKS